MKKPCSEMFCLRNQDITDAKAFFYLFFMSNSGYFSYVVGTSAQTADVSTTSRPMRVLLTLHLLLAYGFNTTILAISINVAANFISP